MAIISDIYNLDGSTPSSTVPSKPDVGMFDMISTAIDKPSVTFGAAYRTIFDKAEQAKEFTPEELAGMYPDAPEGTFKQNNTKRMAEWLYKRAVNDDLFEAQNMIRSLDDSAMYNTVSGFGYDLLKETSPTDIALAVATSGIVTGLAKVAQASKIASVANVSRIVMAGEGGASATVKAIMAREAAESLVNLPMEYLIMKGVSPYTQEQYGIEDALVNALGGTAVATAGRLAYRSLRPSRILDRIDPAEGKRVKNGLQEYYDNVLSAPIVDPHNKALSYDGDKLPYRERQQISGPSFYSRRLPDDSMIGKFTDLNAINSLTTDDAIKLKVYNFPSRGINIDDKLRFKGSQGVPMYALYNANSVASSNGVSPFGRSIQLASNPVDVYGFSAVLNIGGDLIELNPNQFKMLNTLDVSADTGFLHDWLKSAGYEGKTLKESLQAFRAAGDDLQEIELQNLVTSKGYDGIILEDIDNILGKEHSRINSYLFSSLEGADKNILDRLDGNNALLDGHYIYDLEKTKSQKLIDGEAVFTNGKKITMNKDGYFDTDVFYGAEHRALGYMELFGKDQIDNINRNIELNRVKNIKKKYAGITDDMVDWLKDVQTYKEFLEAEDAANAKAFAEQFQILEGWERVFDDILQDEYEDSLVKAMVEDIVKGIDVEDIAKKSVDQLNAEGKAMRVLDEADLVGRIKRLNKQINDRLDEQGFVKKGKEAQVDGLIRQYEENLKYLKDNNPDVAEEIAKQADYCLRINS